MVAIEGRFNRLAGQLTEQLNAARGRTPEGKVSFTGFGFDAPWNLLTDLLKFDQSVPRVERERIARDAVFKAADRGDVTPQTFFAQANRLERQYLSRPTKRFVLLTQVSVSRLDSLSSVRVGGLTMSFPVVLPTAFRRSWDRTMKRAVHSLHGELPKYYRWARVSTRQRCSASATDAALEGLQLLLGLWNMALNYGTDMRFSTGRREPVNEIGLGPMHTIHRPSGVVDGNLWWYSPDYAAPLKVKRLGDKADRVSSFAAEARRRMARVAYRDVLEDWIRTYDGALDERDFTKSFILLWRALEESTHTGVAPYTVTVNRASSLYSDREYHKDVLEHLRLFRNRLVHEGGESESLESNLYRLKGYVEQMLLFHIFQGNRFASLEEVTDFLDLPASDAELSQRLALLQKAVRMRRAAAKSVDDS